MFSGIVRGIGRILEQTDTAADRTLTIGLPPQPLGPLVIGGSIAVSGVCLTVTSYAEGRFTADVSAETLAVTTLGRLSVGANVNLEPPMRVGDPIDGHLVTGHVDGVGEVVALSGQGRSTLVTIELPSGLERYVARKGSIAVDGVSLTVNAVRERRFDVNIIPHTSTATVIAEYRSGSAVNIEVDIIARYLERLEQPEGAEKSGITLEFLQRHGYASND
jgi:riboflavin synthase